MIWCMRLLTLVLILIIAFFGIPNTWEGEAQVDFSGTSSIISSTFYGSDRVVILAFVRDTYFLNLAPMGRRHGNNIHGVCTVLFNARARQIPLFYTHYLL
ncbi:hypothetical protein GGR55DRAFT_662552 [Xylaria sp. FL0064]|nr:hypothetical protein GGR55DRAFT_662552 [Xylaria sp. FL0064]